MQLVRSVRWKGLFVLMAVGMISLALAGLSANRAAADPPSGYHLAFDEEFNGTSLAGTKFNYVWTGYPGVTNTTDAVSVGNGCLTLTTYSTGSGASLQNWGGCVATNDSYQYTYGYTEARIKFNNTQGCNMAFWEESNAMFENPGSTPGRGNETDILEQRRPMATTTTYKIWTISIFGRADMAAAAMTSIPASRRSPASATETGTRLAASGLRQDTLFTSMACKRTLTSPLRCRTC